VSTPHAPSPPKVNGFAIAGLVCALPLALLGIIFSAIALGQINRSNGRQTGRGLAIAGLVISILMMVVGVLAAIAIPAFLDYMHKSKTTDAVLNLNRLGKQAKMYYIEHAAFPEDHAGPTPAAACCTTGGRCPLGSEFQTPAWETVEFDPVGSKFQYSYTSTPTRFEALAVGDLDCDGISITYKLIVDAPGGMPRARIEEPTNAD
jgi:peptidyl-prolyl cis-trans isomerase B (cyclophilin B)